MRRAIPVVLAAALASPAGLNVPVDAQEARLDRLVQSRSLEQPLRGQHVVPHLVGEAVGPGKAHPGLCRVVEHHVDAMEQLTTKLTKFKSNNDFIKLIQGAPADD